MAELPIGLRLLLQDRQRVRARGHGKAHGLARSVQDALRRCRAAHGLLPRQLALAVAATAPQLSLLPDKQAVGSSCAHLRPRMPLTPPDAAPDTLGMHLVSIGSVCAWRCHAGIHCLQGDFWPRESVRLSGVPS